MVICTPVQVEMTAALKLIRQRDRENATLANQVR